MQRDVETGAFFVDRSPELFQIILQFLRTGGMLPVESVMREHGPHLRAECEFFGLDWMAAHIRGDISPFDMRLEDRVLQDSELRSKTCILPDTSLFFLDFFKADHSQIDRAQLQLPLLLDGRRQRPTPVATFEQFYRALDEFTGFLLDDLSGITDVMVAGGAVTSALIEKRGKDVDIFLYCSEREAEDRFRKILSAVQQNQRRRSGECSKILVTRSYNAITIYRINPNGLLETDLPPIQIILALHRSALDVLLQFDIDACCFGLVPGSNVLRCTPRGLRAMRTGVNIADTAFGGNSYDRQESL